MQLSFMAWMILAGQIDTMAGPILPEGGCTEISRFLEEAVGENRLPGVVAIVANRNHVIYHGAFGKREVARNVAMEKNDIFQIASMTKPVTSVAVLMLCEEGKLTLDDPLEKHLPDRKADQVVVQVDANDGTFTTEPVRTPVTIRHLLTHTSGYGYNFTSSTLDLLQSKTGKWPAELPLLHQPGARWTYGVSTDVLGEVVEKVAGCPLDVFFNSRIFEPLQMRETLSGVPDDKLPRLVSDYVRENGAFKELPKPETVPPGISGGGGLFSTAEDYVKFLQCVLNGGVGSTGRLISEVSIDAMTQNQIGELFVEQQPAVHPETALAFPLGAGRDKFGFGFQIQAMVDEPNIRSPGSLSWGGIMNTHFWVDRKKAIVAVMLTHVLPYYDEGCIHVLRGFEERIYRNLNGVIAKPKDSRGVPMGSRITRGFVSNPRRPLSCLRCSR